MQPNISVILCTHNPREAFLTRTLAALREQSFPQDRWELLIIDNAGNPPLEGRVDVRWHANGRIVREESLGLTPARLRGIREARADVFVFVDDDNLLRSDYLQNAFDIAANWPQLGAWGGTLKPEFEKPPQAWAVPHLEMLAIRKVDAPRWSNQVNQFLTTPAGAGMVIRRQVAETYAKNVATDSRRASMDRKGNTLMSSGDIDMAYTACDIGLGTGLFPQLELTHIIPAGRLEESYLLKMAEMNTFSDMVLRSFRGELPKPMPRPRLIRRIIDAMKSKRLDPRTQKFQQAHARGWQKAIDLLGTRDGRPPANPGAS